MSWEKKIPETVPTSMHTIVKFKFLFIILFVWFLFWLSQSSLNVTGIDNLVELAKK